MAEIKNIEGLSVDDINRELSNGAKFVIFKWCISLLVITLRQGSDIYFIKAGESTTKYSIGFTLITFFLGWWGIPWGPIYSIGSLVTNFSGGEDITQAVLQHINAASESENDFPNG